MESNLKYNYVDDINITKININKDERGDLGFIESNKDLPFAIERIFYITNTPKKVIRGNHAHKLMSEFLIALTGKIRVFCDDGIKERSFILDSPDKGLLIPPTIWTKQIYLEKRTTLIALSDRKYEQNDYIINYGQFRLFRSEL